MGIRGIELIRNRLAKIHGIPEIVAQRASARILEQLRSDATTKRGNVPSYGKFGDVPITVEVRGNTIHVNGPDWVLKLAQQKQQVEQWVGIVHEEARKAHAGGLG